MKLTWNTTAHIPGSARYVQANDRVMLYSAEIPAEMTLRQASEAYFATADYAEGLEEAVEFTLIVDSEPTEELSVSPAEVAALKAAGVPAAQEVR